MIMGMGGYDISARRPIDAKRRKIFLETLARTGSLCGAAQAATPWARGRRGGWESFRDLAKRDAEFAAKMQAAKSAALAQFPVTGVSLIKVLHLPVQVAVHDLVKATEIEYMPM